MLSVVVIYPFLFALIYEMRVIRRRERGLPLFPPPSDSLSRRLKRLRLHLKMFHDLTLLRLFGKEQNYNAGCPKHCRIRTKGTGQIQGGKPGRSDLGLSLAGLHPSNEGLFIARERAAGSGVAPTGVKLPVRPVILPFTHE